MFDLSRLLARNIKKPRSTMQSIWISGREVELRSLFRIVDSTVYVLYSYITNWVILGV